MSPKRDFSAAAKEKLLATMEDIAAEDDQFWIFSGLVDAIDGWFISRDIADYEGDIEAYHHNILDAENTSKEKLEAIWANVYAVDGEYAPYFQDLSADLETFKRDLSYLADSLDPQSALAVKGVPLLLRPPIEFGKIFRDYSKNLEFSTDHDLQEQIFAILEEDGFTEQDWKNADTPEKRQAMLQRFYDRVREIMGIDAEATLVFEPLDVTNKNAIFGAYRHSDKTIRVNSILVEYSHPKWKDLEWREFYTTIIHEARHAYQRETDDFPGRHIVSDETRSVWSSNILKENHIEYEDDPRGYFSQPIEWDARGFSKDSQAGESPSYQGSWPEDKNEEE